MSELQSEELLIELSTGISVEADLWRPQAAASEEGNKIAVCLHPWSWLGGRKGDPCVLSGSPYLYIVHDTLCQGSHVSNRTFSPPEIPCALL